jgi:hypothetical protein
VVGGANILTPDVGGLILPVVLVILGGALLLGGTRR